MTKPNPKTTYAILKALNALTENGPNNFGWQSSQAGNPVALKTPVKKPNMDVDALLVPRRIRLFDPKNLVKFGSHTDVIINPTMAQTANKIEPDDVNLGDKAFKRSVRVTEAMGRYLQSLDRTVPLQEKDSKADRYFFKPWYLTNRKRPKKGTSSQKGGRTKAIAGVLGYNVSRRLGSSYIENSVNEEPITVGLGIAAGVGALHHLVGHGAQAGVKRIVKKWRDKKASKRNQPANDNMPTKKRKTSLQSVGVKMTT